MTKLKPKAVLFDMDGLILDTEKVYSTCWIAAAKEFGFDLSGGKQLKLRSNCAKYAVPLMHEMFGPECDYLAIRERRKVLMEEYFKTHEVEKKPYVEELLRFLKDKGIKRAVSTATNETRTKEYLTRTGLYDKFDEIICASMVENGKPDPDVYMYACERLGEKPGDCLALEDSPNGVLSASRAGVPVIMVPDLSEPDDDDLSRVYGVAKNLLEVEKFIE
ncbi:MAG: HAD family phosphatase [Catonella sp.]|nr:HAD family phosphatase [Catonella sp.]MDY6356640.1 HAD family phosphatase [Catonella sp.]